MIIRFLKNREICYWLFRNFRAIYYFNRQYDCTIKISSENATCLSANVTFRCRYIADHNAYDVITGMVITLQTATEFIRLGAQSTVGGIVTIAVGRELGPVLAGVVTAGRVGAAITAEISTMKVTEQIDALKVMATNPIGYLVVPRLIACMFMLPILVVFGDVIGSIGGWMVAEYYDINIYMYLHSIDTFVDVHDITGGLLKSIVFGAIIAIVGCYYGLNAQNGAEGVGKATTRSVVISIIVIFFSNCLLSMLLYR